ncbi:hypothetical protein T4B_11035 [Trichinella pseudospiralis]|uniref:Uncharacterized protein n=1 Tax=Trichinella pseudospiralis TaxID=6337 RepID=A0A0V1JLU4_TRIPS|nr:hypothetical protein T4B_11035 [Trichinella pseudospiralis]KRZ35931.1 hypothetical protein T4C_175 [Trichinella pseudospiralis]
MKIKNSNDSSDRDEFHAWSLFTNAHQLWSTIYSLTNDPNRTADGRTPRPLINSLKQRHAQVTTCEWASPLVYQCAPVK